MAPRAALTAALLILTQILAQTWRSLSLSAGDEIRPRTRMSGSGEGEPGRRRSTSRGKHGREVDVVDRRRLVTKMDRIDSIPVDHS